MTAPPPTPADPSPTNGMDSAVLVRQSGRLAADLRALVGFLPERVDEAWRRLSGDGDGDGDAMFRSVCLLGDGDSLHAGTAAEAAFERLAGLTCEVQPAQRFLGYHVRGAAPDTLVVAVSASGRTERVLQGVARARSRGLCTLGISGSATSPLAEGADAHITVGLPDPEPSPGVRTHQASLVALLLLALRAAESTRGADWAARTRAELLAVADGVAVTEAAVRERASAWGGTLTDAPVIAVLGTGPAEGTAGYAAAKLVEGAGVLAYGRDLEEWWHVERFAAPLDAPVVVLAPPGPARERALELADRALDLGRRVALVTPAEGTGYLDDRIVALPVHGTTREEFAPLLYQPFAAHLAFGIARALGRSPFQKHRPTGPALR
ncbi:SIS domain-containing protein [Streptomyces sp. NPDC047024]|uniref:SIS domain-containing protein n=1 Tax=Streptomyces sp. NPDC047024 TaxID=3155476 RepID=UPI003402C6D9